MSIRDAIAAGAPLGVDTAPFIYHIEGESPFAAAAQELFEDCLDTGRNRAVTTIVTLAEVLVGAFAAGRRDLAKEYRRILGTSANLTLLDITAEVAERVAELRARYRLRLPDAFQVAAALSEGAAYFITNDRDLKRIADINVIVLSDLVFPT